MPDPQLLGLTSAQVDAARRAGNTNASGAGASRTLHQILRANLLTRFNLLLGGLAVVAVFVGPVRDATFIGVVAATFKDFWLA